MFLNICNCLLDCFLFQNIVNDVINKIGVESCRRVQVSRITYSFENAKLLYILKQVVSTLSLCSCFHPSTSWLLFFCMLVLLLRKL